MKRCPTCSRSFPDDNQKFCTIDGASLVMADKPFDPNATIAATSTRPASPPAEPPKDNAAREKPASTPPAPDFGATIATSSSAPTAVLPKQTGPTGSSTAANLQPPQKTVPPQPPQKTGPPPPPAALKVSKTPSAPLPQIEYLPPVVRVPQKKSKLPLILGILAILFVLGLGTVVAAFFLVIKPRLDERNSERPIVVAPSQAENTNTIANNNANTAATEAPTTEAAKTEAEFVAPPNTTKLTNSQANLDGKLAEHYFDFSFYYPDNWVVDPKAGVPGATNFAKVERRLPPDLTQENFAVGWYTSKGTFAADEAIFPQLVEVLGKSLTNSFSGYRKVSEGPTKVNSLDGYEFRFVSVSKGTENGDVQVWGRVIFLPTGTAGDQSGATLVMLASSLAPELSGVEDVGVKGQMPIILESFRFAKSGN